jgi:hypothetical protein
MSYNREQHPFTDDLTTAHNCRLCGVRKSSPAHARYENAARPFRAANEGMRAGTNYSLQMNSLLRDAARTGKPFTEGGYIKPPSTGNSGKDHRFNKWKDRLATASPGSQVESASLSLLTTFSRGYPALEQWVKAETIRRKDVADKLAAEKAEKAGRLYIAPLGTETWPEGWVDIGSTDEGFSYHTPNHVHFDFQANDMTLENIKKAFGGSALHSTSIQSGKSTEVKNATQEVEALMNVNQNPADMEKAALRLATLAQEIREHDEREPQGDEPVITWKHTFTEGGDEYTYVAVKLGDRWYVTGNQQSGTNYAWRDFMDRDWAKPVAAGDFLICSEWTPAA